MLKIKVYIIFLLCISTATILGKAQSSDIEKHTIYIKSKNDKVNVFENLYFYVEEWNDEFDLKKLTNANFYKPEKFYCYYRSLNYETVWMRFRLHNKTSKNLTYYFIYRDAYLYLGTVYIVSKSNNITQLYTHNFQNIKKENTYFNYPTWKINIPQNEEITVYVKNNKSVGRLKVVSLLKGEKDFFNYVISSFVTYMAFIAFFFFAFAFSLYASIYSKKPFVIFYGLYIIFICVDYLCIKGIGYSYIWTDIDFLKKNVRALSDAISALFLCLFFFNFYNLYKFQRWVKNIFLFFSLIFVVFLILYLIKYFAGEAGFLYLYKYVWKTINVLAIVLILIHSFLALKGKIPLYVPAVFIIQTVTVFINSNFIFPYYKNAFLDWIFINNYYMSTVLEITVLSYFVFLTLVKEKKATLLLQKEFEIIQQKLTALQAERLKSKEPLESKLLKLKSGALVNTKDILYIKSDGHYVEYFLEKQKHPEIDRNSLSEVLNTLPSSSFVRIHKSYIVNIYRIKIINSRQLMLDNSVWLNLSRTYKPQIEKILHKN